MRTIAVAMTALVAALAGPAAAKDIPLNIHWRGKQPTDVSKMIPGGFKPLSCSTETNTCTGSIEIDGNTPEKRIVILRYDNYNYSIYMRVHIFLKEIEFTVELEPAQSCTKGKVSAAAKDASSVPDALKGTIAAGQLLVIASPNNCDADMAWDATQARYRQNVRLMQISDGFFLVNPEFAQAYLEGAESTAPRHRQVNANKVRGEIAEYEKQQASLEAVQLRIARDEAKDDLDFALAAKISETMYQRVLSDEETKSLYKDEGLLEKNLRDDTLYLKNIASSRGEDIQ